MRAPSIAVRCSGVTKSFPAGGGLVEVLHGINFEAPAGELTMLVGPSGCGKTTLISIIAGILSPTTGMVETCGIPITQLADAEKVAFRRRAVGFVFQQYNLLPALTAAENAAIPLVAAGVPLGAAAQKAAAILEQIGMTPTSASCRANYPAVSSNALRLPAPLFMHRGSSCVMSLPRPLMPRPARPSLRS